MVFVWFVIICNELLYGEPLGPSVRGPEDFVMLQQNTSVTLMCRLSQEMRLNKVMCWNGNTSLHQWESLSNWLQYDFIVSLLKFILRF